MSSMMKNWKFWWKVTDSGDVIVSMASIQPGDCIRVQGRAERLADSIVHFSFPLPC